jgi:hypothetical protein
VGWGTRRWWRTSSGLAPLSAANAVYGVAVPKHPHGLQAEILFARLGKLREKCVGLTLHTPPPMLRTSFSHVMCFSPSIKPIRYVSWVILGQVADLDAFVEANVTTVADWDANFKMLKVCAFAHARQTVGGGGCVARCMRVDHGKFLARSLCAWPLFGSGINGRVWVCCTMWVWRWRSSQHA